MALGLKALGLLNVSIGGTYARIMGAKGNTIATYQLPRYWSASYINRKAKLGKDITVMIHKHNRFFGMGD
jgi:hypothetical protein